MLQPFGRFLQPLNGTTTPAPTSGSGTLTTAAATVRWQKDGDWVSFSCTVVITTNGTGATDLRATMPYTAAETTPCHGTDNGVTFALTGHVTGATLLFKKYDGTYPGGDGVTLRMSGRFRV